jgi:formylmethanofuran dehydrogenase subunit C
MTPNDKPIPEHQFFVHNKHKTLFNTPDHLIESAIVKATGSTIKNKEKIVKGDVNEVYGIETVSGESILSLRQKNGR